MKQLILFVQACLLFCLKGLAQIGGPENLPKYPLKGMSTFCGSDTQPLLYKTIYFYDGKQRPIRIEEVSYFPTKGGERTTEISYNAQGLVSEISTYEPADNKDKSPVRKNWFYYDEHGLLSEIRAGRGDQQVPVTTYIYRDSLLWKQINNKGGGYKEELLFYYDATNRLIKKCTGTSEYTVYEYDKNRLVKETRHFTHDYRSPVRLYEYNQQGLLTLITKEDHWIEKNYYDHGRLTLSLKYEGFNDFLGPDCEILAYKYEYW